jgi:hypothetical protein
MRQIETVTDIRLRQNDDGEYWLDFHSTKGTTSIGLSRGSNRSTQRVQLETWAEAQFLHQHRTTENLA